MDLWAYALAYRITKDEFMWKMARDIASGQNMGDIGLNPDDKSDFSIDIHCADPFALLAFLELYKGTGKRAFLKMAKRFGDDILANRFHKGFFIASNEHIYAKFDAFESLALLHLHTAITGGSVSVPVVWPNRPIFHGPYRYRYFASDCRAIYSLTDSKRMPMSLEEMVAIGDIEGVKRLISRGVDVNERTDGFLQTPLHRAVMEGHSDIVKSLLIKGADVDARTMPGDSGLHIACKRGHKEIVAMLIVKGADINAKNDKGETPIEVIGSRNRQDIIDLLKKHGATEERTQSMRQKWESMSSEEREKLMERLRARFGDDKKQGTKE